MAVFAPPQATGGEVARGVVLIGGSDSIRVGLLDETAVAVIGKTYRTAGGILYGGEAAGSVGGEGDELAAIVAGGQVAGGIVIEGHAHGGSVQDGEQFPIGAEGPRDRGCGGAQGVGAVGGAGERIVGAGDGEQGGGSGGGDETVGTARPAAEHESAVRVGGEAIAQTERPADAENSGAHVVHVERLLECESGRGSAEGEFGDAYEEGEVGRVDEDLGEAGVAAGRATAQRIVGRKAILRGAAERSLGAIPASAQTGIPQY